jgi:hypothetical protein
MEIQELEQELQRRWRYPYEWRGVQNDRRDRATNFVYRTASFDDLLAKVEQKFGRNPDHEKWFDYTLNRWYNYWSAKAVEGIFSSLDLVTPARDSKDRLVDFYIGHIKFDLKTSIFPQGFGHSLDYAQQHPKALIEWFYRHQSRQRRRHLRNRLFLVLFDRAGQHWKLKAEITWLKALIEQYVSRFSPEQLHHFCFDGHTITLADVIWAIK